MDDLIRRSALLKSIREVSTSPLNEWDTMGVLNIVNKQPTVEAKEVVHGEWLADTGCLDSVKQYKCSNCGNKPLYNLGYVSIRSNFCPYCGADMRKKKV